MVRYAPAGRLRADGQRGQRIVRSYWAEVLRGILSGVELNCSPDAAVDHVMDGLEGLRVHPDVPEGIDALAAAGFRLITLSNGSARIAEKLLRGAGIGDRFEALLSVEDAAAWKPARASYEYAAAVSGADPAGMLLVAVHPWDIHGAARAGLRTAWLNRTAGSYPDYFEAPTLQLPL